MDVFGGSDYYERLLKATQDGELIELGEVVTCLRENVTEWSKDVFARACKIPLSTLEGIESGTAELQRHRPPLVGRGEGPQEQREEDQKGQQHERHFGFVVCHAESHQPCHPHGNEAPGECEAAEQGSKQPMDSLAC